MSAVSGFGDLLQIPARLPHLVSPEKRKQGLACRLRRKLPPFTQGGSFIFKPDGECPVD